MQNRRKEYMNLVNIEFMKCGICIKSEKHSIYRKSEKHGIYMKSDRPQAQYQRKQHSEIAVFPAEKSIP